MTKLGKRHSLIIGIVMISFILASFAFAQTDEQKVVKLLRTTNKAQVLKYVPKVYTFTKVNPYEVVNYFTSALMTEEGGAYSYAAPDGQSGKILVICPEHQIPYFDQLAKDLDRPKLTSAPGSKYIYYRMKHRSVLDGDFVDVLYNFGGEALIPDVETNSILIFDAPSGSQNAEDTLKNFLDSPTDQVQFDVKIYEVNLSNNGQLGLDYMSWKNGPGKNLFSTGYSHDRLYTGGKNFNTASSGYGFYMDYPSAYFDFLVSRNKAKVLVNTRLTAMDNQSAVFQTFDQFLIYQKQADQDLVAMKNDLTVAPLPIEKYPTIWQQNTNINSNPSSSKELVGPAVGQIVGVNSGIEFRVNSDVGEQMINLNMLVRVNDIVGYDSAGNPVINSRQFADNMAIPVNTEVMIGGLNRDYVVKSVRKFPILGSLPVLGWLFGGESELKQKSIVVVSMKPMLVQDYSGMNERDREVVNAIVSDAPIAAPETLYGFDQWLFDSEK